MIVGSGCEFQCPHCGEDQDDTVDEYLPSSLSFGEESRQIEVCEYCGEEFYIERIFPGDDFEVAVLKNDPDDDSDMDDEEWGGYSTDQDDLPEDDEDGFSNMENDEDGNYE